MTPGSGEVYQPITSHPSVIDLVLVAMYIWFFYFFRFRLTRSFGCLCIFTYLAWLGYQLYNVYK